MTFHGKTALVTGAASGIGSATARLLCQRGVSRILLSDVASERLAELRRELAQQVEQALDCACDISRGEQLGSTLEPACRALGRIDIVVNSAGVSDDNEPEQSAIWQRVLDTNLNGTYRVTLAALPYVPDGGRIIVVSSILGRAGRVRNTAYAASKHGLLGFTKSLALDLASRRITVNAVLPGLVNTPMLLQHFAAQAALMGVPTEHVLRNARKSMPIRRLVEPVEVAELIGFLASEGAAAVTAQSITIDGGYMCGA